VTSVTGASCPSPYVTSSVLHDAALDNIATSNQMVVCSQQPANRTEAVTTYNLASVSMAGGDFTKAAGDVSGRKVTVAAKSGINVTASGSATHVALVTASDLKVVTTVAAQTLTSGNTVSLGTWKVEYQDPT
jgi:hypothetical protein